MSLNAWEWEDEDRASVGPVSSVSSFHPSGSECEVDEDLQVGAWAQESESDHQCSSRSSAGSVSAVNSDVPHVVPCTFVISLAFPVTAGRKGKYSKLVEKHRKQPKMDRPVARVRSYCHLEYFLLPDDREPKRVDIVVFSGLAKVFLDSRIKTVRPWPEGDKVWVSWTQTFNIKVTKELLKKINFHKITLRLWDTKEKIPKRVKYYRLKAAAALEDVGSSEEVKHLVLSQRRLSEQGIHVKEESHQEHLPGKPEKAGKGLKSVPAESETFSQSTEDCEKLLRTEDLATARCNISRPAIFLGGASSVEMKELTERLSFNSLSNLLEKQKFQMRQKELDWRKKSQKRRKKSRAEEESDSRMAGQGKQGAFSVQLAIMPLLAGRQIVVTRGRGRSANILDCFLTLETEVPIMTEEQKRDLNPLTIRIKCVSCLPTQPVCTSELEGPHGGAGQAQGAPRLAAALPPPPLRRPGGGPAARAPVPAAGAAGEAGGALRARRGAAAGLPGPEQDPLHLLLQHQAPGGHHQGPAALLRHDQGAEPGVWVARFPGRAHRGKAGGPSSCPQPRGLPAPQSDPHR
nr:uncharacterized protein KIAA1257 homolog isoform X9 [Camelus dromedarius]